MLPSPSQCFPHESDRKDAGGLRTFSSPSPSPSPPRGISAASRGLARRRPPPPHPSCQPVPLAVPGDSEGTGLTQGAPARPRPEVGRAERGQLRQARLCHARGEAGLARREGQPQGARLTPSKGKVTQEAGTLLRFSPPTSLRAVRGVAF